MRGGDVHDLVQVQDHAPKYRCGTCGERFQVRSSAPSCRLARLREIDKLADEFDRAGTYQRGSPDFLAALEHATKRRLHWPKFEREVLLALWQRYEAFKAEAPRGRP